MNYVLEANQNFIYHSVRLINIFFTTAILFTIACNKQEIFNTYVSADTYPKGSWESQNTYYKLNERGNINLTFANDKNLTFSDEGILVRNIPLRLDTFFLKSSLDIDFNYNESMTSSLSIINYDSIEGEYELIGENRQNWIALNKISKKEIEGSFQFLFGLSIANPRRVLPDTIKLTNGSFISRLSL